jgi:hypothetical protein
MVAPLLPYELEMGRRQSEVSNSLISEGKVPRRVPSVSVETRTGT